MQKTLAVISYLVLAAVTAVLVIMTILQSAGVTGVFSGMPIIAVFSVFVLCLAVSLFLFNPKLSVYHIGFYLLHAGIVIFLVSGLIYTVSGQSVSAAPPNIQSITPTIAYQIEQQGGDAGELTDFYNRIGNSSTGETVSFDFGFRIPAFKTEYYEDENGNPTQNVKHYEATIEFRKSDGSTETKILTVNHPLYYEGYKIYLMSAQENSTYGYQEVTLLFKQDKTEFLSDAGIVLTVIGTFMMCFGKARDKTKDGKDKKNKDRKKTAGKETGSKPQKATVKGGRAS